MTRAAERRSGQGSGKDQLGPGTQHVRVRDRLQVGVPDHLPLVRRSVDVVRDLGQRVPFGHDVDGSAQGRLGFGRLAQGGREPSARSLARAFAPGSRRVARLGRRGAFVRSGRRTGRRTGAGARGAGTRDRVAAPHVLVHRNEEGLSGFRRTEGVVRDTQQPFVERGAVQVPGEAGPGVSRARDEEAVGLFAAIPATIFYNIFVGRMRGIAQAIDLFTVEYETDLRRMASGSLD